MLHLRLVSNNNKVIKLILWYLHIGKIIAKLAIIKCLDMIITLWALKQKWLTSVYLTVIYYTILHCLCNIPNFAIDD